MKLFDALREKLVDDWHDAKRWRSMQAGMAGLVLSAIGLGLSASGAAAQWSSVLPPWAVYLIGVVIFLCVLVGRVLKQADKPDETDQAGV